MGQDTSILNLLCFVSESWSGLASSTQAAGITSTRVCACSPDVRYEMGRCRRKTDYVIKMLPPWVGEDWIGLVLTHGID